MYGTQSATNPVFLRACGTYMFIHVSKTRLYSIPQLFLTGNFDLQNLDVTIQTTFHKIHKIVRVLLLTHLFYRDII